MIDIGAMIRQLRDERGFTQEILGNMINTTKQTISNYENNRRTPDYETLEALADVFNVPMSFFLTKEEQEIELERIRLAPHIHSGIPTSEKENQPTAVPGSELDEQLISDLTSLSPQEVQRVLDFISGLKASRKEQP